MSWITAAELVRSGRLRPAPLLAESLVKAALTEDLGRGGDLTSDLIFAPEHQSSFILRARQKGVLAGLAPALTVWALLDETIELRLSVHDGERIEAGTEVLEVRGATRALLTGERTALNFLGHLSGIATRTRKFVDLIEGTNARIVDTRKTLPGLRAFQKYAVTCGGGFNHRLGLDDGVLIKDNHIAACGSLTEAVRRARTALGHTVKVEVEVDTLVQFQEALPLADIILLDNFTTADMVQAVAFRQQHSGTKPLLEASGGVNETNVRPIAETGIDVISIGALTHSVTNFDFGLDASIPLRTHSAVSV